MCLLVKKKQQKTKQTTAVNRRHFLLNLPRNLAELNNRIHYNYQREVMMISLARKNLTQNAWAAKMIKQ